MSVKILENNCYKVRKAVTGDALKAAALAGGQVIEAWAKINANTVFSDKATNTLAGSISTVLSESSETFAAVDVGPTVVYGRIHELGGIIKPVIAKALHFVIDGIHVVTQSVQIPPRPYLRPAVDEHRKDIEDAISYHLKAQIEQATK